MHTCMLACMPYNGFKCLGCCCCCCRAVYVAVIHCVTVSLVLVLALAAVVAACWKRTQKLQRITSGKEMEQNFFRSTLNKSSTTPRVRPAGQAQ